jgi:hypothetical protein
MIQQRSTDCYHRIPCPILREERYELEPSFRIHVVRPRTDRAAAHAITRNRAGTSSSVERGSGSTVMTRTGGSNGSGSGASTAQPEGTRCTANTDGSVSMT